MRLHRFFIDPKFISGGRVVLGDKEILNQLKKVLRLKVGDKIIFLDNTGKEYLTIIEDLNVSIFKGRAGQVLENKNEPELKITLYQALCKKDKFEWVLEKGTEVGISAFVPMITERTEKLGLNRERAEKILKEAAEQSERGIIPKLLEMEKFDVAILRQPADQGEKILLDRLGENIKIYIPNSKFHILNIFIGPEGGFTENELKVIKENGIKIISIGSRVLRTETAGLVAAAILLNK